MRKIFTTASLLLLLLSSSARADRNSFERLCDTLTGNTCDGVCDGSGGQAAWYVQTEAIFLSPLDTSHSQQFALNNAAPATIINGTPSSLDADEFTMTPRLTLGRQLSNGWGIQARYWDLNVVDGTGFAGPFPTVVAPPSVTLLGGTDSVEAYTLDIEATKCLSIRCNKVLGTLGVRHGALEHRTTQSAFAASTGGESIVLSALNENTFHGTGVTYSLLANRPLKSKCLSIYAGGRVSHLFGESRSIANTSALVASPVGGAASTNGAIGFDDDILTILETQVGLQWARCLSDCRAQCFARVGFEYQLWTADDNFATATSFAGGPGGTGAVSATAAEFDTHFIGLGFSTGFAW